MEKGWKDKYLEQDKEKKAKPQKHKQKTESNIWTNNERRKTPCDRRMTDIYKERENDS